MLSVSREEGEKSYLIWRDVLSFFGIERGSVQIKSVAAKTILLRGDPQKSITVSPSLVTLEHPMELNIQDASKDVLL